ncbi:DUF982 domain-containing protein [Aquibium carbonis]|uniref:DUF982 domain-containing protein n=2 Tax=Aquibium carbonis TaxID=2495581 RepID=A0A3S0G7T7_9HYPH|nr:DUF982 domain-containing protein [Aquibium carbonis]
MRPAGASAACRSTSPPSSRAHDPAAFTSGKVFRENVAMGHAVAEPGPPRDVQRQDLKQRAQPMALFHEPVKLLHGNDARMLEIRDAAQAAMALENGWPEARGKWYWAARQACRAAGEGRASPHIARRIFLRAVEESRQPQLSA